MDAGQTAEIVGAIMAAPMSKFVAFMVCLSGTTIAALAIKREWTHTKDRKANGKGQGVHGRLTQLEAAQLVTASEVKDTRLAVGHLCERMEGGLDRVSQRLDKLADRE